MLNLDLEAQNCSRRIIENVSGQNGERDDKGLRRALAVLQEQGPYACILYLTTKERDRGGVEIAQDLIKLSQDLFQGEVGFVFSPSSALKYLSGQVVCDLQKTLIVKQLWEQTLIYARYACKQ